ncbi:hypothetical protein ABEB36_011055 [Hypothenemus hampei]|uniref:Uncharacterized protein n=1 Tax=Hypothenemus hampei TaxID=57062 RepID=A0ABD1EI98_HYPHA
MIKASRPSNPFNVVLVEPNDVKDFDPIIDALTKPRNLKIIQVRWIRLEVESIAQILTKISHRTTESWKMETIKKANKKGLAIPPIPLTLAPMYDGPIPLNPNKKKDLESCIPFIVDVDKRNHSIAICNF